MLRIEVVAQVHESAAGEMLSAAGKKLRRGGRERERRVQDGTLTSPLTRTDDIRLTP